MTTASKSSDGRDVVITPATTIDAGLVELRHLEADSAAVLVEAINDNLHHLQPWMDWARSPATLGNIAMYLALQHERFVVGDDFSWCLFDGDRLVGGCGLHSRSGDADVREVGYWLRSDAQGRGFATAAASALVDVAFDVLGLRLVRLRCAVANERSRAVAQRAGFHHVETSGDSMLWEQHREAS